ncbi:MAG: hypothetical protein ACT4P0_10665 [Panacagrimonas sp.]
MTALKAAALALLAWAQLGRLQAAPAADARPEAPVRETVLGRVIADPRWARQVASHQAGWLEPPPGGFPVAGSSVRAGQVLGYLRPGMTRLERSDLEAELATAQRDVALGALQVKRFNANEADQFDGQLPLPSIQILGDYRSAQEREAQYRKGLKGQLALTAPADAWVVDSTAGAGRSIEAGEALFELAPANRLVIEGLAARPAREALDQFRADGMTWQPAQLIAEGFDPALRSYRQLYSVSAGARLVPGQPVSLSRSQRP